MGLFHKEKPINSDEYEKLAKRISHLEGEFDKFEVRFLSLRGLIHRKWKQDQDIPDEEDGKKEKPLNSDGLDALRVVKKNDRADNSNST